jgi:starvation-inducible DNA-binding protein
MDVSKDGDADDSTGETRKERAVSEKAEVRSFPAPEPLSTPTDLPEEDVRKVTEAINSLVADAFALYIKTKSFHWHLSGARFRDLHLLFDEQAEAIFSSIDTLAERVRRIGGTTIRSVSHVSELQTISDNNEEFVTPDEMVRNLMEDNRHLAEQQRKAHEVCDGTGDVATTSALENIIDETERRTWFLYECLKDTDRFD